MPQANRLKLPSTSARCQAENKALWNEARDMATADFFTIGYTGRKFEELLAAFKTAGIRTLVDIRQFAVSMYRPELSRSNLSREIELRGERRQRR